MPRYKLTIEYDGTAFVGWQKQANGLSIQEAIETAGEPLGAARQRLAGRRANRCRRSCDRAGGPPRSRKAYRPDSVRDALNSRLKPHPIAVRHAVEVTADFDARHSAVRRRYLYRIANRRAPLALEASRAWLVKPALDAEAMNEAARCLLGRHDFTTFRDSECQAASPVRTLEGLDVVRLDEHLDIKVWARSFLHRQVRSMVGSLVEVGLRRWSPADLRDALEARDRARCGTVAPAAGLYLTAVDYP